LDSALTKALEEAGVSSIKTALKLVDKETIEVSEGKVDINAMKTAINDLKEEHGVLFQKPAPDAPSTVRTTEDKPAVGYAEELKKLRENPRASRSDLEALRRKYGKN
jgi:hypothetical protein